MNIDQDAVIAAARLAERAGARQFEIGYLHDGVPVEQAAWYAHVQYRGARISVEDQPGPVEAAEALARRLLAGAKCRCGRLVALSDAEAVAFEATLVDGSMWTPEQAQAAGRCRWTRQGDRWTPGCDAPPIPQHRGVGVY